MAPLPAFIVGYPVDNIKLERYRQQHKLDGYNLSPFVRHLESEVGVPIALARVDDDGSADETRYYVCCFADYSGHTYGADDLPGIPIPAAFERVPELLSEAVIGELQKLFVPRAMLYSYDGTGRSRIDEHLVPIGGESK